MLFNTVMTFLIIHKRKTIVGYVRLGLKLILCCIYGMSRIYQKRYFLLFLKIPQYQLVSTSTVIQTSGSQTSCSTKQLRTLTLGKAISQYSVCSLNKASSTFIPTLVSLLSTKQSRLLELMTSYKMTLILFTGTFNNKQLKDLESMKKKELWLERKV